MIFYQKIYKLNDEYVVILPAEELEKLGFSEGQEVQIQLEKVEEADIPENVRQAFEASLKHSEEAYRYLSEGKSNLSPELQALVDETWEHNKDGLMYLARLSDEEEG
jgi:hypothetical protein